MIHETPSGTVYELVGPKDASAIVLIHGLGLNRECWQWTSPALSGEYRVLTYDLFGHGDSTSPLQSPSLSLFSQQLAELMDHCEIASAGIVGFSLGGMIARRFAQEMPERTSALAIMHSPHQRSPEAQTAIVKRVEQAKEQGPSSTVEAALERWFTDEFRALNPQTLDLVRHWVTANRPEVYHTIYRVLADGIDEITAPDPPISCPTLVMTADQDYGNGPEMSYEIASEIAGAEVHILPGLRHMALAEAPDRVNAQLVRFFDSLQKSTTR